MRIYFLLCFLIFLSFTSYSQQKLIFGKLFDSETKEPIIGANILLNKTQGTVSKLDGSYEIYTNENSARLEFRYIGYVDQTIELSLDKEKTECNIKLEPGAEFVKEVVITASKFKQSRKDVSVSMEVINTDFIENNLDQTMESTIQKIPGMMIMDGQASIRGGSGYSYGAGSRVLLLIDGMPMMTGASGEAKWEFIPTENVEQIEIIKGASSSLYGSSALNGVVNVRTIFPKSKPQTRIIASTGLYGKPLRSEIEWNDKPQIFNNINATHARKVGNLDIIVSAFGAKDKGYKKDDFEDKFRVGLNAQYNFKKIKGLKAGVTANYMFREGNMFLLWKDGDSGVYQPSQDFIQQFEVMRFHVDPQIEYLKPGKYKHTLRSRFYSIENQNNTNQNNKDVAYYSEYQYQRFFSKDLNITSGITSNVIKTESELYGGKDHNGFNIGLFTQIDKKYEKLNISLGGRLEGNSLNGQKVQYKPVFRSGVNYNLGKASSIRASFGQGYRYPSVAEKYTFTQVGSLNIFSNDTLQAETGWSSEIGFFQGYKFGNHSGIFDIALFWTEYQNMIEFMFDYHFPTYTDPAFYTHTDTFSKYIGFKAYNISSSRIYGVDISLSGKGQITDDFSYTYLAGYTYTNPTYLEYDSNNVRGTSDINILKYRFYHNVKLDLNLKYKNAFIGLNLGYHSNIMNIDKAFEDEVRTPPTPIFPTGIPTGIYILPGLKEYRQERSNGDAILNVRIGYDINEKQKIIISARNVLNREYMIRPADVQPPRNFMLQYNLKI